MSKSITHLGPTGSGAMVKLINNFVCGVQLTSIAEAMAFLERTGIDRVIPACLLALGRPPGAGCVAGARTGAGVARSYRTGI